MFLAEGTNATDEISQALTQNRNAFERFWQGIDWEKLIGLVVTKAIALVLVTVLFFLLFKIGRLFIRRAYRSYGKQSGTTIGRARTLEKLVDSIFHYLMFFIYLYTFLEILGLPIGTLLTGAGIAGLAIGLGAQGFMNDLITGFFIIVESQLDVGDHVKLLNLNMEGFVVQVGIRTLKLKSIDGAIHFIPNRNITTITNLSRENIRVVIDTRIRLEEDIEKITQVIHEVTAALAKTHSGQIQGTPEVFGTVDLGGGNYAIRVILFVVNGEQSRVNESFTTEYIKALTENGFSIPSNPITPFK